MLGLLRTFIYGDRDVKGFGWVVLVVGVIWAIVALNMDVSVATGYGRVNNLGLMASRQNHIIIGSVIALFGLLMIIFGKKNSEEAGVRIKCPFCAEPISPEAIKCKHCGSDVSEQKEKYLADRPKEFISDDFVIKDQQSSEVLNFESIKAMAKQLHHEMPKNTALSVMVTHAPVINRIRDGLPKQLRKKFEIELEGMLKAIKGK